MPTLHASFCCPNVLMLSWKTQRSCGGICCFMRRQVKEYVIMYQMLGNESNLKARWVFLSCWHFQLCDVFQFDWIKQVGGHTLLQWSYFVSNSIWILAACIKYIQISQSSNKPAVFGLPGSKSNLLCDAMQGCWMKWKSINQLISVFKKTQNPSKLSITHL